MKTLLCLDLSRQVFNSEWVNPHVDEGVFESEIRCLHRPNTNSVLNDQIHKLSK